MPLLKRASLRGVRKKACAVTEHKYGRVAEWQTRQP